MLDCGKVCFETDILSGSPMWQKLLTMIARLPPTDVEITLDLTGDYPFYAPPIPDGTDYYCECMGELAKLNPDHQYSEHGTAYGDARWLIEAAVKMVEDPPDCCIGARRVPDGYYMLTLDIEFANLILYVAVFRKSVTALQLKRPRIAVKPA